ncbi:unnamed protein product [Adineta ricciae]|uniref:Uncharacterized protein n=1 Tax=Adineta ricciae TaxID=249248 RepID=A0A814G066_ADIRI|nr:unnamed protein product [Adineta ricciae]
MAGPENINDHNENIRQMQSELETLRSKGSHAGSSYDRHIGDRIAYLKAQIHVVTLKRIIDLTSVGRKDGTPAWKDVLPQISDGHVYSYNPCYSFTQVNCLDVAACQAHQTDPKLTYSLGTQNSVQWRTNLGQELPTLVYKTTERTLEVTLKCLGPKESNRLDVQGLDTVKRIYSMTLSSKCACWDGCGSGSTANDGISGGLVFIIVLFALLCIYLIGFMVFNKFKRQATGLDMLPHRTFWISLPGYALAGTRFIFGKITNKKTDYSSIP